MEKFSKNCPENLFRKVIRVSAVDGALLPDSISPPARETIAQLQLELPHIAKEVHDLFFTEKRTSHATRLGKGEMGCFLSHVSVWKKIASGTVQSPCLILEDDTQFEPWFEESMGALYRSGTWQAVEDSGAVLYLGGRSIRNFRTNVVIGKPFHTSMAYQSEMESVDNLPCQQKYWHCVLQYLNRQEAIQDKTIGKYGVHPYHFDRTTQGYVLSRKAAVILLASFDTLLSTPVSNRMQICPVDHFIIRVCILNIPVLTLSPLPSFADSEDSDIQS